MNNMAHARIWVGEGGPNPPLENSFLNLHSKITKKIPHTHPPPHPPFAKLDITSTPLPQPTSLENNFWIRTCCGTFYVKYMLV